MIDNFDKFASLVRSCIEKYNYDIYGDTVVSYRCQVMTRTKDGSPNRVIKSYYLTSLDSISKYKDEIVIMCNAFNARAYVDVCPVFLKNALQECARSSMDRCFTGQYDSCYRVFDKSYKSAGGPHKVWLFDCDNTPVNEKEWKSPQEIEDILFNTLVDLRLDSDDIIIDRFPTKNGYHILVKPFNVSVNKYLSNIVKKNNSTILYMP